MPSTLPATTQAGDKLIALNFPEGMPLKVLVDYVSQRTGMNLLYDEQVGVKRITIKANAKVPESSLLGLLQSVLKMNELALVDSDQPGWKRIVAAQNLVAIAQLPGQVGPDAPVTTPVTQVFQIRHVESTKVDQVLKPFLSARGANTLDVPDRGVLIVTDYAGNMARLTELVQLIDQPKPKVVVEFLPARHMEAAALAQQAGQLLASKMHSEGVRSAAERVDMRPDARTNNLVLIGRPEDVAEARKIIDALDVKLPTETKVYQFDVAAPERIDRLIREYVGPLASKTRYQSAVDKEGGMLIVTATPEVHEQLATLKASLDVRGAQAQSPVRFYKLSNTTAEEVMKTIQAIEGKGGIESVTMGAAAATSRPAADETAATIIKPPVPAATGIRLPVAGDGASRLAADREPPVPGTAPGAAPGAAPEATSLSSIQTGQARVTADANTNSIIVVADPAVQQVYEQLIRMLDRRRPQVLIECTLVTVDTSRGFSLGVELSRATDATGPRTLLFSSFGLSDVNANSGALSLKPGAGFNGALLGPDMANIVVRALSTHARAHVVSAPRILINDNSPGQLSSVNEAPFTSVNASNTVATTTFAGYATAGTTIAVTPHISEGDHLQVEYQVTLSSFGQQPSSTSVPPPRQTNTIQSRVTIPDGSTIVVGGLNRQDESESTSAIPGLEKIPVLSWLFSSRSSNAAQQSLFVFIRPVILRNEQFEDLKYLSQREAAAADLPPEHPVSEPMTLH